jgi:hypothetical protein
MPVLYLCFLFSKHSFHKLLYLKYLIFKTKHSDNVSSPSLSSFILRVLVDNKHAETPSNIKQPHEFKIAFTFHQDQMYKQVGSLHFALLDSVNANK